jgi:hypothetical protein
VPTVSHKLTNFPNVVGTESNSITASAAQRKKVDPTLQRPRPARPRDSSGRRAKQH